MDYLSLFENDFLVLMPEIFLVYAACFLLMYGVLVSGAPEHAYVTNTGFLVIFIICKCERVCKWVISAF